MAYQGHFQIMNVKDIRYTQSTIRDTFSDDIPLQYTIHRLKSGQIKPEYIKPIRVGKYNGHYRTIDNRRLYCFKQSNIKKIKVKYIHDIGNSPDFRDKYTSNSGGTFIKIRKEHAETFFYCDVCDINMTFPDKMSHLNGKRHYENALQETLFYCDVCDSNMKLSDKMSHLNGRRHHKNSLKNQNTGSTRNKKLSCIPASTKNAETLFYCDVCGTNMRLPDKMWHLNGKRHQKNVLKNQNIDNSIKNKKLNCSNNKNVVNGKKYKKTVRKPVKNKSENVKDIKELSSDANNKGIYDVKCRSEPVVSYKPKSDNVLRLRELQLEQVIAEKTQQVNAYKIKFAAMQQQIYNYEVKLRTMNIIIMKLTNQYI